jgi:SAM-dependent methyltransferase
MSASSQTAVFDRVLVRRHRDRAAAGFAVHDVLFRETAQHLADRLGDIKRDFLRVLDLGAHNGFLLKQLPPSPGRFAVAADLSARMLKETSGAKIVADEEYLPFAPASFDLIVNNLSLHWVNDVPGALAQIRRTLRPDGLFLAVLLGGQTLHELRGCLLDAELAVTGGVSPRLSPVIDLPMASALMQRAGFALPVVDQETLTLTYPDIFTLMRDLRGMGQNNALIHRLRHPTRRTIFAEADRLYRQRHARPDGSLPATFDILFLHGWQNG